MKIDKNIPFFSNTSDNTHCFQACLKMILKYYFPKEEYSWEELDKISAKVEGLWTWPMAGLVWLNDKGLEIKNIEIFDYDSFISNGRNYLIEEFGKEVGEAQIKNSNIEQEINISKEFLKKIKTEKRIPDVEDLIELIKNDYAIICNVNAIMLNNKEGYSGHFVLIKGIDDRNFIINDPGGAPGYENRLVDFELFHKAWAYPNERAKGIMAFRLRN